jgi:hypothetical protein
MLKLQRMEKKFVDTLTFLAHGDRQIVEGRVEVCATRIRPWLTAHNIPHVDRTTADGAESCRSTEIE